jgi:FKBP-type peptidyl-prolyl cis-trans isomerase
MKPFVLVACLSALAIPAVAQTANTSKKAKPEPIPVAKPTEVTGPGITTKSKLQYWDIRLGTGAEAQRGQHAKVVYSSWLTNGHLLGGYNAFEFVIGTNRVKGFDEGLIGMKVGGKRQLRIPPELAYGHWGIESIIPRDATLIFDVELLDVR